MKPLARRSLLSIALLPGCVVTTFEGPGEPPRVALTGDADHLLVASYNAENLDPLDPATRFTTIASEVVNRLKSPDIIALQEVQDNDGPTNSSTTSANLTLQNLVNAINAELARVSV